MAVMALNGEFVLIEALKASGRNLTRKNFKMSLETMNQSMNGLKVSFSKRSHQALSTTYLTRVKGGKAVEISNMK